MLVKRISKWRLEPRHHWQQQLLKILGKPWESFYRVLETKITKLWPKILLNGCCYDDKFFSLSLTVFLYPTQLFLKIGNNSFAVTKQREERYKKNPNILILLVFIFFGGREKVREGKII